MPRLDGHIYTVGLNVVAKSLEMGFDDKCRHTTNTTLVTQVLFSHFKSNLLLTDVVGRLLGCRSSCTAMERTQTCFLQRRGKKALNTFKSQIDPIQVK